jgi:hypothetical protein
MPKGRLAILPQKTGRVFLWEGIPDLAAMGDAWLALPSSNPPGNCRNGQGKWMTALERQEQRRLIDTSNSALPILSDMSFVSELPRVADELNPIRPIVSCVSTCATATAAVLVERERTKQSQIIVVGVVAVGLMVLIYLYANRTGSPTAIR